MSDAPTILDHVQRRDSQSLARLIMLLIDHSSDVVAAFNQIISTSEQEQILAACAEHPLLALPLLEGWLKVANEFETPKLQGSIARKLAERARAETERLRLAADAIGPLLAEELVVVQQLSANRAAYADQIARIAELRNEKVRLEAELAEFEQLNSEIPQLRTRKKRKEETNIPRLRQTKEELQSQNAALARQEAELEKQNEELDTMIAERRKRIQENTTTHKQALNEQLQKLEPNTTSYDNYIAFVEQNDEDGQYRDLVVELKELHRYFFEKELEARIKAVSDRIDAFNNQQVSKART